MNSKIITILGLIKSPNILVLNSNPFHPKEVFIKAVTYQPARVVDRSQLLQTSLPHPPFKYKTITSYSQTGNGYTNRRILARPHQTT